MKEQQYNLEIIAGPCSIGPENIEEVKGIAELGTVSGIRVVGLKSRTGFNPTGEGMGIDFESINKQLLGEEANIPPSAKLAHELVKDKGVLVATEVMMPEIQIPHYIGIPEGKLLLWNPSVNQLGWQTRQAAQYANEHGWAIGLKNGKALGATLKEANEPEGEETAMEKTWTGLAQYAHTAEEVVLIHRGVDVPEKGDFRNALVHEAARRAKRAVKGSKLYFDPSHSFGPKLRDQIVEETIKTMHMRDREGFLYDGVLIETGTSKTDTNQHITVNELEDMTRDLGKFRKLRAPEKVVYTSHRR